MQTTENRQPTTENAHTEAHSQNTPLDHVAAGAAQQKAIHLFVERFGGLVGGYGGYWAEDFCALYIPVGNLR